MKLIVQPDDGVKPLIEAIVRAKKSVTIVIFRSDLPEMEKALSLAMKRGVEVHALIAHTSRQGDKGCGSWRVSCWRTARPWRGRMTTWSGTTASSW